MKKKVVVTGSGGFIGRNLIATLSLVPDVDVMTFDLEDSVDVLKARLSTADFVFHLAGVNRPKDDSEFEAGNAGLTQDVVNTLGVLGRPVPILITSSTQAALDNAYGASKKHAEEIVLEFGVKTSSPVYVYRLPNVFGKWSRPNYNSVVATFCHNVAHGLPLAVHDPARVIDLVHIDDVIAEFVQAMNGQPSLNEDGCPCVPKVFRTTLGDLAGVIRKFPDDRRTRELPPIGDELGRRLYSMYLSYLPKDQFEYDLDVKCDPRGWLAEVLRSPDMGQIFISVTKPGITRGNHWHHTKTEKFVVVSGDAVIRFRQISGTDVIEYRVSGSRASVVDIPPGYTHSITNVGENDLVTLFWASEPFNQNRPDTYALDV